MTTQTSALPRVFWVVTFPGEWSTLDDILFKTDLSGLRLQFLGGLEPDQIAGIYGDQEEATVEARRLMEKSQ